MSQARKPNNFPREGKHTPVTREAVRQLERSRPVLNAERHYTIDGPVEAAVHTTAYAQHEAAITSGHRRLDHASGQMRVGYANAKKPGLKSEYIRAQKQAAKTHPARNMERIKGPSR